MKFRSAVLAGLTLAALAVSAAGQKDKDEKPKDKEPEKAKAKVFKTPQECFDAFMAALDKDDHKAWIAILAPQAQKDFAAELAILFASDRAFLLKDAEKEDVKKGLEFL